MPLMDVPQPPAIYRHYEGEVILRVYPSRLVDSACRRFPGLPARTVLACAIPLDVGKCLVIMPRPSDVGTANYARLKAHELGHCAGWED
jgi:hypothetical protein